MGYLVLALMINGCCILQQNKAHEYIQLMQVRNKIEDKSGDAWIKFIAYLHLLYLAANHSWLRSQ